MIYEIFLVIPCIVLITPFSTTKYTSSISSMSRIRAAKHLVFTYTENIMPKVIK